jgi:hypothetical protein
MVGLGVERLKVPVATGAEGRVAAQASSSSHPDLTTASLVSPPWAGARDRVGSWVGLRLDDLLLSASNPHRVKQRSDCSNTDGARLLSDDIASVLQLCPSKGDHYSETRETRAFRESG